MDSINFDMTTGEKSGRKLTAGTKEGRQKEIYIHLIERSRSSQVSPLCHASVAPRLTRSWTTPHFASGVDYLKDSVYFKL